MFWRFPTSLLILSTWRLIRCDLGKHFQMVWEKSSNLRRMAWKPSASEMCALWSGIRLAIEVMESCGFEHFLQHLDGVAIDLAEKLVAGAAWLDSMRAAELGGTLAD